MTRPSAGRLDKGKGVARYVPDADARRTATHQHQQHQQRRYIHTHQNHHDDSDNHDTDTEDHEEEGLEIPPRASSFSVRIPHTPTKWGAPQPFVPKHLVTHVVEQDESEDEDCAVLSSDEDDSGEWVDSPSPSCSTSSSTLSTTSSNLSFERLTPTQYPIPRPVSMLTLSLRATVIRARNEQFRLPSWRSVMLPPRGSATYPDDSPVGLTNDHTAAPPRRCFPSEPPVDNLPVLEVARRLLLGKDGPTVESFIPAASQLRDLSLVDEVQLRAPPPSPATSPVPVSPLATRTPTRTNRQHVQERQQQQQQQQHAQRRHSQKQRDAGRAVPNKDVRREMMRRNLQGEEALTMLCERWRPGDKWDKDANVAASGVNSNKSIRKVPLERAQFAGLLCREGKAPYVEGLEGYGLAQQCDDAMVYDHEFRYF